jgi:soluble lytic murein transglycosylase-like protein
MIFTILLITDGQIRHLKSETLKQNTRIKKLEQMLKPYSKINQHIKVNSKLDPATAHDVTAGIIVEAYRNSLEPELVTAVMLTESSGNPLAKSKAGAKGLMQLMPVTFRVYGGGDVWSWRDNLSAGCKYLADLTKRFGGQNELILASYNVGPSRPRAEILRAAGSYPGKVNRGYRRLKYGTR